MDIEHGRQRPALSVDEQWGDLHANRHNSAYSEITIRRKALRFSALRELVDMSKYIPILVIVLICVYVIIFFHLKGYRLILKWISDNPGYLIDKSDIEYPWLLGDQHYANIIALESSSGTRVNIKLRLGHKWLARLLLDKAVCESVTPIEE